MNDFRQIAELSPISDAEAGQFVSERTHADLVAAITATSSPATSTPASARRAGLRVPITRRWAIVAPVVLGVAGAMLIANLVGRPGQHVGPINIGPANAKAALTFTRHGHYIDVFIKTRMPIGRSTTPNSRPTD